MLTRQQLLPLKEMKMTGSPLIKKMFEETGIYHEIEKLRNEMQHLEDNDIHSACPFVVKNQLNKILRAMR